MQPTAIVFTRELTRYFVTPVAYVFIIVFLLLGGILTFYAGDFLEREPDDLQAFFAYHPWLYLVLIPLLATRRCAAERHGGTTGSFPAPPARRTAIVLGKFLAAWSLAGIALALTFPFWLTVRFFGEPDNGVIVASYLASWLVAGATLAIGAAVSAATRNQVIACLVTAALVFVLTVAGTSTVLGVLRGWAPEGLIGAVAAAGLSGHFMAITRGVIDLRDIVYFLSLIIALVGISAILADLRKAD